MIAGDTQALPKKRYFFISASEVAINVFYCMLHLTHRFIFCLIHSLSWCLFWKGTFSAQLSWIFLRIFWSKFDLPQSSASSSSFQISSFYFLSGSTWSILIKLDTKLSRVSLCRGIHASHPFLRGDESKVLIVKIH